MVGSPKKRPKGEENHKTVGQMHVIKITDDVSESFGNPLQQIEPNCLRSVVFYSLGFFLKYGALISSSFARYHILVGSGL